MRLFTVDPTSQQSESVQAYITFILYSIRHVPATCASNRMQKSYKSMCAPLVEGCFVSGGVLRANKNKPTYYLPATILSVNIIQQEMRWSEPTVWCRDHQQPGSKVKVLSTAETYNMKQFAQQKQRFAYSIPSFELSMMMFS